MERYKLKLKGEYIICNLHVNQNKYNKEMKNNLFNIIDRLDEVESLNHEIINLFNGILQFKKNVKNDKYRWDGLINTYNEYYKKEQNENKEKIELLKKEIKEILLLNNISLEKSNNKINPIYNIIIS